MKIKPPSEWTKCKGIFVGGCIEGKKFQDRAHCHSFRKDSFFGWICIHSLRRLGKYHLFGKVNDEFEGSLDKPSQLLIHEYAHLLVQNQGHIMKFYQCLKELGGHITKRDIKWAPARNVWFGIKG